MCAIAEPQVIKGRRFGNIVLLGEAQSEDARGRDAASPHELDWLPRLLAGGPHPARLLNGKELAAWIGGAKPVFDADATPSPTPPKELFG